MGKKIGTEKMARKNVILVKMDLAKNRLDCRRKINNTLYSVEKFTLARETMNEVYGFIYLGLSIGDNKFIEKYWENKE